ncbi:MAG: CCA tRNA nucleotidyltransferase [Bifidobacteriaceae bacterium]|nr:CCA tRNA nucleotidyltransferase [Bifidobacteriaceae bacterium]
MIDFAKFIPKSAFELGKLFEESGYELSMVGGSVRDIFLQKKSSDYDFATDAKPNEILQIVEKFADSVWTIGKKYGTIGIEKAGKKFEITTFRSDSYSDDSRKPEVKFGDNLEDDLKRRDFTINAIALRIPSLELVDPFHGLDDLLAKLLKTPIDPEVSFSDDPLRIMRLFRFMAQLDFATDKNAALWAKRMKSRLGIVSKERIQAEFSKLLMAENPVPALDFMTQLGVMDMVIPEFPKLKLSPDERGRHKDNYWHSLKVLQNGIAFAKQRGFESNLTIRIACLLHDIGKIKTRKFEKNGKVTFYGHDIVGSKIAKNRLKELKFDNKTVQDVSKLIKLHMRFYGYAGGVWTDSAARRYAHDAGDLLDLLHILSRADCTTGQDELRKKLRDAYDDLEKRIQKLKEEEEIRKIKPSLDGDEIMEILNLPPGEKVGCAREFMLEYRLENGEVDKATAKDVLLNWYKENK